MQIHHEKGQMAMPAYGGRRSLTAWISAAAALAVLAPTVVSASDGGTGFQNDPVELWTARGLTWVLLTAIVLALFSLVAVARNGGGGRPSWVVLLVAVVLLPSFAVASGMLLVFMRAERVEFCASCHLVMSDYAKDMTDPDGTGLAAIHYANRYIPSNQCYDCHTSYGLFGTVEAKLNGIAEVYRYYTRSYSQPIVMWHPYSNADCLKCHAESRKWLAIDAHVEGDTRQRLFDDLISCMDCHVEAHLVGSDVVARSRP
jgi:nitrate/TMAO reductase-like tetraheme cytochrome c subunit